MKGKLLLALLVAAVIVSVYFTYQRSFVWQNFELINSEEEVDMVGEEDEFVEDGSEIDVEVSVDTVQ